MTLSTYIAAAFEMILLTSVDWMVASHEGGPAGRADGVDVVVVEDHARVGQGVNVGRGHLEPK